MGFQGLKPPKGVGTKSPKLTWSEEGAFSAEVCRWYEAEGKPISIESSSNTGEETGGCLPSEAINEGLKR